MANTKILAVPPSTRQLLRLLSVSVPVASAWTIPHRAPYSLNPSRATSVVSHLLAAPQPRPRSTARSLAMAARTALDEVAKDGEFRRKDSVFRNWIRDGNSEFQPEAGRYHLYISKACPWANRCWAVLKLKGLEHVIGVSIVHPTWQATRPGQDKHCGWAFADPSDPPLSSSAGYGSFPPSGCVPDTVNGARFVRDLYDLAHDTGGKYTVPVLWDKKKGTIVSNESADIILMLNSEFNRLAKKPEVDLYPAQLRAKIDAINEWIYPHINNGVYRCGFASSQAAYDTAFNELFSGLDKVEGILANNRYLCGDTFTIADVRLFMTLIRFDCVYIVYFKTDKKRISVDYPHTFNYVKELYQMPEIGSSTDFYHIQTHYFSSHPHLNPYAIIPGRPLDDYSAPHDRDRTFSE